MAKYHFNKHSSDKRHKRWTKNNFIFKYLQIIEEVLVPKGKKISSEDHAISGNEG